MSTRIVPFTDGMKIGIGYNRLSGDRLPTPAVQGASITTMQGGGGQLVTSDCITIKDVETLHTSLGISIDAGGSYMGFSGSAKVDYANSCDFSSFSTYVIVRVKVANATETLDAPVFTADAVELLVNGNSDRFRQRFGDTFIAGVLRGGEFFAIYQITGSDESEKEALAVKVNAAYTGGPLLSGKLNTDITTATSSSSSHLSVKCHVFRQGSIGTADLNLEDILATAKQFPIGVSGDKAFPYAVLLQDYNGLKSPNDKFSYVEIQNRQDVLEDLGKKRFAFLSLRDDLAYILKHIEDFQNSDGTTVNRDTLVANYEEVVGAINTMQKEAAACTRDAQQCSFTKFEVAKFSVPILRRTDKILFQAGPTSWPRNLAIQTLRAGDDFSIRIRLRTDFSDLKTPGFMGLGLALMSETDGRLAMFLKGVGSGGRELRGGIHSADGAEGIEIGKTQVYSEDDIFLRMSKKGDQLIDMSFSRDGEEWSIFAENIDLTSKGFKASGKYKVILVGYSTCGLPVSGKVSDIRATAI